MSEWCIVAIPEEDSNVWRYSSEKIPHMTLLYFGEQDDPEIARQIATQLQHTVNTSLSPFTTEVHSRGVLGGKSADVLFFDQAEIPKELMEFRSLLLKDETIRKAYDSVEQYPSWTPHLTMGYPDKPAKKPKEAFGPERYYSVHFNRIALWINDFDGPTFKLNYKSSPHAYPDMEVAMSDETRAFLAHSAPSAPPVPKSMVPPSSLRHHGFGKLSHSYQSRLEKILPSALKSALVTDSLQHGKMGVDDDRYVLRHQSAVIESVSRAVGSRPSDGDIRYDIATRPNGDWILSSVDVGARQGTAETYIRPVLSHSGEIVDYRIVPGNVSEDDLRYSLMHYGVKGMRWGRRMKSSGEGGGSDSPPTKKQIKAETKAEAKAEYAKAAEDARVAKIKKDVYKDEGKKAGRKQAIKETWKRPVSDDAESAAAGRGRVGKHGTDAMTNKELQALVNRMNLEQQYANLKDNEKASSGRSAAKAYVSDILKDAGRELAVEALKYAATEGFSRGRGAASNAYENRRARARADILQPFAIDAPRRAIGR